MKYLELAEKYQSMMIADLCELISIPSVTSSANFNQPFGAELANALEYLLNKARSFGFEAVNYDNYAGEIIFGEAEDAIGIVGHLDVVPATNEGWNSDPFIAMVKNGIVYGRGSNDNKGPVMAVLYAMVALKESGYQPKKQIKFILGCDEEGFMQCMDYYKRHTDKIPLMGFVPDCTFPLNYGEHSLYTLELSLALPKYLKSINAGEHYHVVVGSCEAIVENLPTQAKELFEFFLKSNYFQGNIIEDNGSTSVKLNGLAAHGSRPQNGHNAAIGLLIFIASVYQDQQLLMLIGCFRNNLARDLGVAYKSMKYGELTQCITKVASHCQSLKLYIDIRYPSNLLGDELISKIKDKLKTYSIYQDLIIVEDRPGFYQEPTSTLVSTLVDTYNQYYPEQDVEIKVSPGDTYARKFANFVAFGPTTQKHLQDSRIGQAHQVNEGMDIATLVKGCAVYIETIKKLTEVNIDEN